MGSDCQGIPEDWVIRPVYELQSQTLESPLLVLHHVPTCSYRKRPGIHSWSRTWLTLHVAGLGNEEGWNIATRSVTEHDLIKSHDRGDATSAPFVYLSRL